MPSAAVSGTYNDDGALEVHRQRQNHGRTMSWPWIPQLWTPVTMLELWIENQSAGRVNAHSGLLRHYANVQAEPVKYSVPVPVTHEITVKIKARPAMIILGN